MGQPWPLFRLFSYFRLLSVLTSLRAQVQKPKHNFQAFSISISMIMQYLQSLCSCSTTNLYAHVVPPISMVMQYLQSHVVPTISCSTYNLYVLVVSLHFLNGLFFSLTGLTRSISVPSVNGEHGVGHHDRSGSRTSLFGARLAFTFLCFD